MRDPSVLLCGLLCVYPLIFFALPGFLLGRYRVKLRSPVQFSDKTGPTAQQIQRAKDQQARYVKPEDRIGYGPGNK